MKQIIGRIDKADFPELALSDLCVKIDTGAYTSSIHSHDIKEIEVNGERFVRFRILDPSHPLYNDIEFKVKNYKRKRVKSSFGHTEQRFVIQTQIAFFGEVYPIDLSLSERSEMKYPILLGRQFIQRRFIVDVSLQNQSYKLKKRTLKKSKNKPQRKAKVNE